MSTRKAHPKSNNKAVHSASVPGSHSDARKDQGKVRVPGASPKKSTRTRMETDEETDEIQDFSEAETVPNAAVAEELKGQVMATKTYVNPLSNDEAKNRAAETLSGKEEKKTEVKEEQKPQQPDGKQEQKPQQPDGKKEDPDAIYTKGIPNTDVNYFVAKTFKYRYAKNTKPGVDLLYVVDGPGVQQPANKKRKTTWYGNDPNRLFVNAKFKKDIESEDGGWNAQLVSPVCDVMMADLGLGNWASSQRNKGKDVKLLKKHFKEAKRTILLTARPFEAVEKDESGRNKEWVEFTKADRKMAEALVTMIFKEYPQLAQACVDKTKTAVETQVATWNKAKFDGRIDSNAELVTEGKMTAAEFKAKQESLRKTFMMLPDDTPDMDLIKKTIKVEQYVERFMKDYYTNPIKKHKKTGIEYISFEQKVCRNANQNEMKNPPTFTSRLEKQLWDSTGNTGKPADKKQVVVKTRWNFMSSWGKKAQEQKLTPEQKQAALLKDHERNLDVRSKVALGYSLSCFFPTAGVEKCGFHRSFHEIIFYRAPTPAEIAETKAASGDRVADEDKEFVPGAGLVQTTELTKAVWDEDPALLEFYESQIAKQATEEKETPGAQGQGSGGAAAPAAAADPNAGVRPGGKRKGPPSAASDDYADPSADGG